MNRDKEITGMKKCINKYKNYSNLNKETNRRQKAIIQTKKSVHKKDKINQLNEQVNAFKRQSVMKQTNEYMNE